MTVAAKGLGKRQRMVLREAAAGNAWVQHVGEGRMMLHVYDGVVSGEVLDSLLARGLVELDVSGPGSYTVWLTALGRAAVEEMAA